MDCVHFSETFIELVCAMLLRKLYNTVCVLCKMTCRKSVSKSFPKKEFRKMFGRKREWAKCLGMSQSGSVPSTVPV